MLFRPFPPTESDKACAAELLRLKLPEPVKLPSAIVVGPRLSVPGLLVLKVLPLRAAELLKARVPALIYVAPVKPLLPESVSMPVPPIVSPPAPLILPLYVVVAPLVPTVKLIAAGLAA